MRESPDVSHLPMEKDRVVSPSAIRTLPLNHLGIRVYPAVLSCDSNHRGVIWFPLSWCLKDTAATRRLPLALILTAVSHAKLYLNIVLCINESSNQEAEMFFFCWGLSQALNMLFFWPFGQQSFHFCCCSAAVQDAQQRWVNRWITFFKNIEIDQLTRFKDPLG